MLFDTFIGGVDNIKITDDISYEEQTSIGMEYMNYAYMYIDIIDSQQDNVYDIFADPHLSKLSSALQVYSSDLSESELDPETPLTLIKARIETHIRKKMKEGLSKEIVTKQLNDLTMNALIPVEISDWCYGKLDEVYNELDSSSSTCSNEEQHDIDSSHDELPPLFSKDAVYHASLCALVSDSGSTDCLSECGHTFDEISLSYSVTDKYRMFIAQQKDIVYISFTAALSSGFNKGSVMF